jgi:tetratricopeptide (TPR) repeat protein
MFRTRFLVAATAVLLLVLMCVYVPAGQVAVRESFGGTAEPLGSGLHLRVPLYHRLYRYGTRPITVEESIPIVTRDNATFKMPVKVLARISSEDLLTFHTGRSGRETEVYIRERVSQALRDAAKALSADQILSGDTSRTLSPAVSADLLGRGISDDGVTIGRPGGQVVFNAVLDYINRKLLPSARRLAESSLAADPKEGLYHAAMGMVLEAERDPAAAEKEYREALFLDPAAPEPMSRLYVMYQSSGDPAALGRLERLLEAAIAKNKSSPVHHDWLGQVYMRSGQVDKAETAFSTAIALAPKVPEFRISLGSLRTQEGKLDEARAAFEEALTLRPDQPLALYNMGVISAMQKEFDKAIDFFHRAERAGPPNHALYNSLAQLYEEKGQPERAIEYLKRSLQMRPDQPERKAELDRLQGRVRKRG